MGDITKLSSRIGRSMALAVTILACTGAGTAMALDPPGNGFQVLPGASPELTPAQQHLIALKEAVARQEELHPGSTIGINSASATGLVPLVDPHGLVGTWTRQQSKAYYCGPAAVQVVADFAWNMGQNSVKYTQSYISATWTRTDVNLSTNLADEVVGLNGAVGSRLPSGFIYASKQPGSGSSFHSYLRTDISSYHMPMVVSVSPKQSGALYWLTSWSGSGTASPGNYGHYIVLREWDDYWDNTRNPAIFYNDGSGGYGGATGIYGDPAFDIWYMINLYNPNHAAGWVIW